MIATIATKKVSGRGEVITEQFPYRLVPYDCFVRYDRLKVVST